MAKGKKGNQGDGSGQTPGDESARQQSDTPGGVPGDGRPGSGPDPGGSPGTPGTVENPIPTMRRPDEAWRDGLPADLLADLTGPVPEKGPPEADGIDHHAASITRFKSFVSTPMGRVLCGAGRRHVACYGYAGGGVPNGNPDGGVNGLRIDTSSGRAFVTPECLGYKQRRFWAKANRQGDGSHRDGFRMYMHSGRPANTAHREVYRESGRRVAAPRVFEIPAPLVPHFAPGGVLADLGVTAAGVPVHTFVLRRRDSGRWEIVFSRDLSPDEADALLDEARRLFAAEPAAVEFMEKMLKDIKPDREVKSREAEQVGRYLASLYCDIRRRGGVLSSDVNCGTFAGPFFLAPSWSIVPLVGRDEYVGLTRGGIVNEADAKRKDRDMGGRPNLSHGLYTTEVYYSPGLGRKTGFNPFDLFQCWESLGLAVNVPSMFDDDHTSWRILNPVANVVFSFPNEYGTVAAHSLLSRVRITARTNNPTRNEDYTGRIDLDGLPPGVTVTRLVWSWDDAGNYLPPHRAAIDLPPAVLAG